MRTQFTAYAGHATNMTKGITTSDYDVIVCLGGDGTVHEVANGLLAGSTPDNMHSRADQLPAIVIIPTGSANVLAGSLDIPRNPYDAARLTTRMLRKHEVRSISAGYAKYGDSAKWFVVNAGAGIDADVIATMEDIRAAGKSAKPIRYVRTILPMWNQIRRNPPRINATVDSTNVGSHLPIAVVSNANPWTFLGDLPVITNPDADATHGLGFFAIRSLAGLGGIVAAANLGGALIALRRPLHIHDREIRDDHAESVVLESDEPLKLQLDGEYIDEVLSVQVAVSPNVLKVVAPVNKRHPRGVVKSVATKSIGFRLTAMLHSRVVARLWSVLSRN